MSDAADEWLEAHGLGKYVSVFRENDVGMRALPHLTEDDLRELGLSLGHRRVFDAALRGDTLGTPAAETVVETTATGTDEAEHRHLSVIFSDVVGSTELAEQLDPEDMRDLLRQYQDLVAGAVTRFGGHVAKYMGDGVLAYFGWPTAYEDHADRAVRAGLEVVRAASGLAAGGSPRISVRVGVASGPVVVGNLVGAQMREDGAMSGATVNLAARLQGEAEPDSVVISDETRGLVGSAFELASLGSRLMKGFETPRDIFLVTAERQFESRFDATRGSLRSPLVGRDEECALRQRRWGLTRERQGQVILVAGEAGMGKSRLAEAFVTEVGGQDHELLRLQCSPCHVNSAFHPIIERITQRAKLAADASPAENFQRLNEISQDQSPDPDEFAAVYAALLGLQVPEVRWLNRLEPQEMKRVIIRSLTDSLAWRTRQRPILVVVEDAHWIDPSTLETLERIVDISGDVALMMLLTHRTEWACNWPDTHPHVTALRLSRLGREEVAALTSGLLATEVEPELINELLARTDGVPLSVEEMAPAVSESAGGDGEAVIPDSLQGMLLARLDRVSREARRISLVASVIGREFEPRLLADVAGLSPDALDIALRELRNAEIVYESGIQRGAFAFRHALIQDAAYNALLRRTRRELHGKVARAIERLRLAEIEREPEVVARHYSEAGEHAAALPYWSAAAKRALDRAATYEAVSHATEAIAAAEGLAKQGEIAADEISARVLLSRAYEEAGNLPAALKEGWKAAEQARSIDSADLFAEAALRYMDSVMLSGEVAYAAIGLCREALEDERLTEETKRCKLVAFLARGLMMQGEFEESRKFGREAEKLAVRLEDRKALFSYAMTRFVAPVIARDPEDIAGWREHVNTFMQLADQGDDMDRGRARAIATHVATEMGDRDLMDQMLDRLDEVGAARQHMHLDWVARHGRAMQAILDGDFQSAERFANEALELGRTTHGEHVEGLYGVQMFTIRREQARLSEVAPVIRRLLDENPGDAAWKPGFALIAAELGHHEPARRMLNELAEHEFQLPHDAKYSATLGYLADAVVMIDDPDMAATIYERLLPYRDMNITIGVTTVCYGAAGRRLGALAAVSGDWNAAEEHFERALELDEKMRAVPWLAQSRAAYAGALTRRGRSSDAEFSRKLMDSAMETAQEYHMDALANELRRHLH